MLAATETAREHKLKITDGFVISETRRGDELNRYRRHRPPLEVLHRNGFSTGLYAAGKRYGEIWREAWQPRSPPHSDTTRIVVDGGGKEVPISMGDADAQKELDHLERHVLGRWPRKLLDQALGFEKSLSDIAWEFNRIWPGGLHRRKAKHMLRKALEALAIHWGPRRRNRA